MQLRPPILLRILLEERVMVKKSQRLPNLRTANGEQLVI